MSYASKRKAKFMAWILSTVKKKTVFVNRIHRWILTIKKRIANIRDNLLFLRERIHDKKILDFENFFHYFLAILARMLLNVCGISSPFGFFNGTYVMMWSLKNLETFSLSTLVVL